MSYSRRPYIYGDEKGVFFHYSQVYVPDDEMDIFLYKIITRPVHADDLKERLEHGRKLCEKEQEGIERK